MKGFSHRLAFVVPTKDRSEELRRMLKSIEKQSVHPDQIIIVDGSREPGEKVVDEFSDLNICYVRLYPPSLSKQRNAGMERLHPSITLAGYLDDDIVLEDGALEAMLVYWEGAPASLGGTAFNIVNTRLPKGIFLKSLFLTDNRTRGLVLRSGYQTTLWPIKETSYVHWLCGGATIWRRDVINTFDYDEWFEGTGYMEDIDYSYRVGKKYQLVIVGNARVHHLSSPVRRDRNLLLGKWQVINRLYFVKKYQEISLPLYCWAVLGETMMNLGRGITTINIDYLLRGLGNLMGLVKAATGRMHRIGGHLK